MLNLGKIKMEAEEINQIEFMAIALGAAANIKFAKKCFETSYSEWYLELSFLPVSKQRVLLYACDYK